MTHEIQGAARRVCKGLVHQDRELGEEIRQKLERLKWSLWHGNLYKALHKSEGIESLIHNFEETYPQLTKLVKAVEEFRTYIDRIGRFIPNYGERWRYGSHRHGLYRINDHPSGEQTLLQAATDAMEQTRRSIYCYKRESRRSTAS